MQNIKTIIKSNGHPLAIAILGSPAKVVGNRQYWLSPLRSDRTPGFEVRSDGKCFDGGTPVGDIADVLMQIRGISQAEAFSEQFVQHQLTLHPSASLVVYVRKELWDEYISRASREPWPPLALQK